ncbi:hypothetical protein DFJ77DRAFT_454279 [Powellomyces hirtus]|nr:hypothetical protein DFJ77DRAFT_454279 [Powellomyces hirtus]
MPTAPHRNDIHIHNPHFHPQTRRNQRSRPTVHDVLLGWQNNGASPESDMTPVISEDQDADHHGFSLFNGTAVDKLPGYDSQLANAHQHSPTKAMATTKHHYEDSDVIPPSRSFLGIPELDMTSPYLTFSMKSGATAAQILHQQEQDPQDRDAKGFDDAMGLSPTVSCACLNHSDRILLDAMYAVPVDTVAAELFGDAEGEMNGVYKARGAHDFKSDPWLRDETGRWVSRCIKYSLATPSTNSGRPPVLSQVEETQIVLQHESMVLVVETTTTTVQRRPATPQVPPLTTTTIQRCCITPVVVGGRRGARVKVQARVEAALKKTRLGSLADETVVKPALEGLITATRCLDEHIIRLVARHRGDHIQLDRRSSRSSAASSGSASSSAGPPTTPKNTTDTGSLDILPPYLTRPSQVSIEPPTVTSTAPVSSSSSSATVSVASSCASSGLNVPVPICVPPASNLLHPAAALRTDQPERFGVPSGMDTTPAHHQSGMTPQGSTETIVVPEEPESPIVPQGIAVPSMPVPEKHVHAHVPVSEKVKKLKPAIVQRLRKSKPPVVHRLLHHQNKSCPTLSTSVTHVALAPPQLQLPARPISPLQPLDRKPGGPRPFGGWNGAVPPGEVPMVPPPQHPPQHKHRFTRPDANGHVAAAPNAAPLAQEPKAVVWDGKAWTEAHPVVALKLASHASIASAGPAAAALGVANCDDSGSTTPSLKREGGAVAVWNGAEYVMTDDRDVRAPLSRYQSQEDVLLTNRQPQQQPPPQPQQPHQRPRPHSSYNPVRRVGEFQPLSTDDEMTSTTTTSGAASDLGDEEDGDEDDLDFYDDNDDDLLQPHPRHYPPNPVATAVASGAAPKMVTDLNPKTPAEAAEWRQAAMRRLKLHLEAKQRVEDVMTQAKAQNHQQKDAHHHQHQHQHHHRQSAPASALAVGPITSSATNNTVKTASTAAGSGSSRVGGAGNGGSAAAAVAAAVAAELGTTASAAVNHSNHDTRNSSRSRSRSSTGISSDRPHHHDQHDRAASEERQLQQEFEKEEMMHNNHHYESTSGAARTVAAWDTFRDKQYRRRRAQLRQEHRLERIERQQLEKLQQIQQQQQQQQQQQSLHAEQQNPPTLPKHHQHQDLLAQSHRHQPSSQQQHNLPIAPSPAHPPLTPYQRRQQEHLPEPPFPLKQSFTLFFTLLTLHTLGLTAPFLNLFAHLVVKAGTPILAGAALVVGAAAWVYL